MSASFAPRVVIPGDVIDEISTSASPSAGIVLGPGLTRRDGETVTANRAGVVRSKVAAEQTHLFWVDSHSKRYVPVRGENVIGVVTAKGGDLFRVDIGASDQATISFMAFEGATKKNRPAIAVGDLIYAKLLVASRDMEPELVCVDAYGKKAGLGQLSGGGFMFSVPLHLVRKLLSADCVLLTSLGDRLPFEIAVGMNGRVWVRARSARDTICVANAIAAAEYMTNEEIKKMVAKLADAMQAHH